MLEKKLFWRCRRGVKELDVLLTSFLETKYSTLDEPLQVAFQRLLEAQDPIIMDWLFGRVTPDDAEIRTITELLKQD